MSETVQELNQLLHDQPKVPMRPNQVEEFREEQERLASIVKAPAWQTGADRGAATKRHREISKMLDRDAPKPLGSRQDKVARLVNDLEGQIREIMQPQSTMRRNPAGAVDLYRRGEGSKRGKTLINAWKRAKRALEPDNTDQDYTNTERLRSQGDRVDGTATFMSDAQIPGKFAFTPQAKANWPLGEPQITTPLATAKKREMSEEHKQAARERIAKARAAKAAKAAAQSSQAESN